MALNDLSTNEVANKGKAVALLHPAQQIPIGIRIYVLGFDSKEAKRILREQDLARIEKQKKTRRGVYLASPEETDANALDLLVGLTTGWDEDVKDAEGKVTSVRKEIELAEGQFIPFSPEACRSIYSDPGFTWIRESIDAEIGDRRDFLPKGKKG